MRKKVRLNDYTRVLLTETSPDDVPIIFTNNWLYKNIKYKDKKLKFTQDTIDYLFERRNIEEYSMPMRYKIRKDHTSFRHMGIIHPSQQNNFVEFYKIYGRQILHYCSKSSFSIRVPSKIASSFFVQNKFENARTLRGSAAERVSDEGKFKHSTSYFVYDKYTKLYQFFESEDYFNLESKYSDFWSIDISKCFDSIYSHSISWAIKGKIRSKNIKVKDTFGSIFDKLMQKSNFNETNGIIVGNEVSRVFSEIILQEIDCDIKSFLLKEDLIEGVNYDLKRYVDDYFIFSKSEENCVRICDGIENSLRKYKLSINKQKTKKLKKPFITGITKSKVETSDALNELYSVLFEKNEDGKSVVKRRIIRSNHSVIKKFINRIKSSCQYDKDSYFVMTAYVISSLTNKIKEICDCLTEALPREDYLYYKNVFLIFLKISFHFFSVNSSIRNSLKLSILVYISFEFFEENFPEEDKTIKLLINGLINDFLSSAGIEDHSFSNNFSIEVSNILFASRNMGNDYLMSHKKVISIFDLDGLKSRRGDFLKREECSDYFILTSLLYYIGDEPEYNRFKDQAIKEINNRILNMNDIHKNAKLCYLTLDSISCPFIDNKHRKKWASRLYKVIYKKEPPSDQERDDFFNAISKEQWFISWNYPDLWNILEKKELRFRY